MVVTSIYNTYGVCVHSLETPVVYKVVQDAVSRKIDLSNIDLRNTYLRSVDFKGARMGGARLDFSILSNAILAHCNLEGANLYGANLNNVDLSMVNFVDANLQEALLCSTRACYARFERANLQRVNFDESYLVAADFTNANLTASRLDRATIFYHSRMFKNANLKNTCLDPNAKPNGNIRGFVTEGEVAIGYRKRCSGRDAYKVYEDGRTYTCPVFSVSPLGDHPGFRVWSNASDIHNWRSEEIIKVKILKKHLHCAQNKWRCRQFTVEGAIRG
jgi:uncharacterized protein YjbI with pentapeptide repeats